jgi:hypothetical protein
MGTTTVRLDEDVYERIKAEAVLAQSAVGVKSEAAKDADWTIRTVKRNRSHPNVLEVVYGVYIHGDEDRPPRRRRL